MRLNLLKVLSKNHYPIKRTKMVCTIGPASDNSQILEKLY